jgi:hypothetical protein
MFLHTSHAPLNLHLHHICKIASPFCVSCLSTEESMHHFLLHQEIYTLLKHGLTAAEHTKTNE